MRQKHFYTSHSIHWELWCLSNYLANSFDATRILQSPSNFLDKRHEKKPNDFREKNKSCSTFFPTSSLERTALKHTNRLAGL